MEAYKHSQHELEILRLLAHGEKEIEADEGVREHLITDLSLDHDVKS
jgi:hypothetical protein